MNDTCFVRLSGLNLLGIVSGGEEITNERVSVFVPQRNCEWSVPTYQCKRLEPEKVDGGLMHVMGYERNFGSGVVIEERIIDELLHVRLRQGELISDFIPITMVRFRGPNF